MLSTKGVKITVGCDPEFFLWDTKDKAYVSAHTMVPGDKKNPFKVPNGAIQVDGTAVEFNIDPASSPKKFADSTQSVLNYLRKTIDPRYEFRFVPAIHYDKDYFKSLPKHTKELGCDPDFNAYTSKTNPKPPADKVGTMRTGSGHIHIGWTKNADITDPNHVWDCELFTKAMDAVFKTHSIFWDNDTQRQKLYGNYGAYRPKPYGVEYRVPSNAWLAKPILYPWLAKICLAVFNSLEAGTDTFARNFRYVNTPNFYNIKTYYNDFNYYHAKDKSRYPSFFSYYNPNRIAYMNTAPFFDDAKMPEIEEWTPEFSKPVCKTEIW